MQSDQLCPLAQIWRHLSLSTFLYGLQGRYVFVSELNPYNTNMTPPTNEKKEFLQNKKMCAYLNLWAFNMKFLQNIGHIVFYSLWQFQIDSS